MWLLTLLFALQPQGGWLAATRDTRAPVTLRLRALQDEIVVGEPLRLELRWEASEEVRIPVPPGLGAPPPVEVHIALGPVRSRRYHESGMGVTEEVTWRSPLPAGATEYWDLVLHHGGYEPWSPGRPDLAFPEPGTYRVFVRHGLPAGVVESNAITVRVRAGRDEELAILQCLRENLFELKYGGPLAQEILARHPNSRQLALARVYSVGEATVELREDRFRRIAQQLDRENWGVYEDHRLSLLALNARRIGDTATSVRAAATLNELYPHSPAALSLLPGRVWP